MAFGDKLKEELSKNAPQGPSPSELLHVYKGYADIISKNKNSIKDTMAATFVYAGIAEYLAVRLIFHIEEQINARLETQEAEESTYLVHVKRDRGPQTNLSSSIRVLNHYVFPHKQEVMSLLGSISKNRDKIFHNFLFEWKESKSRTQVCEDIWRDTRKLNELYIKICPEDK